MTKKNLINNQIRASEVRVVDETGKQIGLMPLGKALELAKERGLDLVQVTEKVDPPVCKIINSGKYFYAISKKEKGGKIKPVGEAKEIRLGYNISPHDLQVRSNLAEKFLQKGNKVRLRLILRGREKSHQSFAVEKINTFLELIKKTVPIKIERELKKEPSGLTIIISKSAKNEN